MSDQKCIYRYLSGEVCGLPKSDWRHDTTAVSHIFQPPLEITDEAVEAATPGDEMAVSQATIHASVFKDCWVCKQVLREDGVGTFITWLTFGMVDRRISIIKAWARHQEIRNGAIIPRERLPRSMMCKAIFGGRECGHEKGAWMHCQEGYDGLGYSQASHPFTDGSSPSQYRT